ncbi:CBN-JAMP-1 protein [Caenorhabditis brenneri]|uniref:CBN-JAMP-1 protein n=1 Tax=Caenorhabditis brenneri TaxID=135651 RepID=G0MXN6_CAEBE|nr:CBN-JAMP-1 protein [Caenorhabditis brenneri]
MSMLPGHASTTPSACLGFCGRTILLSNYSEDLASASTTSFSSSLSRCGPCSFGYRNNAVSICEPCDTPLQPYDWMYLLFVAILPLLLHMQFIRAARKYCRTRYFEVSEYLCVILENVIACIIAVLVYPPRFSFLLNGCTKTDIKEWYPACYNPRIGFTKTMRCTYEVVFPLYSITFIHHLILIAATLVLRSTLYCALLYKAYNAKPFYAAIISVPILAAMHAIFSGVVFYSFPYILLIGSLWAMCFHLALEGKRPFKEMIVRLATSPTHLAFLSISMLMLSFGVVAIITPLDFPYRWSLLCVVPVPFIFYLVTIPFTNPTTTMRLN